MIFSVITVSLNSEKTIRKTIESVIKQDYKEIEYIIIDGDSTDSTLEIINEYSEYISKVISEEDKGIYNAINKGIKLASGKYISVLHSDDTFASDNVISEVKKAFEKNKTDIITTKVNFYNDKKGKFTRLISPVSFKPWKLRFGIMPAHPGIFIKKKIHDNIGLYPEDYIIAADFEFFSSAFINFKTTYKFLNITSVIMKVGGISTKNYKSYLISTVEILRALKRNKIYSNYLFIISRIPIKFFKEVLIK